MALFKGVKEHAFLIKMTALYLISIGHDGWKPGDQGNALPHVIFEREIVRIVVIRIETQYGTGQLVHNILGRRLDNQILGEIFRQFPVVIQQAANTVKLSAIGQLAENEQPDYFFEAKPVFLFTACHNIGYADAAVRKLSFIRYFIAIRNQIPMHIAHMGQPRHYAGAVRIAQAALYPVLFILFLCNHVVRTILLTQLLNRRTGAALIVEPLHNAPPPFTNNFLTGPLRPQNESERSGSIRFLKILKEKNVD